MADRGMNGAARARRKGGLGGDLDGAVARDEILIHYQPAFDLERSAVVGAEALLRWRHPLHGLIGPDEFIPLAEEGGQISGIGHWILREACRQAVAWGWRCDAPEPQSLFVNVSGRQLADPDFVDLVAGVLDSSSLSPLRLVLEITETALMEDDAPLRARIGALRELGVRIALDDYGTGYSSMSRLVMFPFDVLKIDRSFVVLAASGNRTAQALVRSMVSLCAELGMLAVAEGIETPEEAARMQACGCRFAQGYLMGRPMPADEYERAVAALAAGADASADVGAHPR